MDARIAIWFHERLTHAFATVLWFLSLPGSEWWIGSLVVIVGVYLVWKRKWYGLSALMLSVPCGTLLNETLKILTHRPRPFPMGPFGYFDGYSFTSGHTTAATLFYGIVACMLVQEFKSRHWRVTTVLLAVLMVASVGFSRIALGAHYLSDVLAEMCLSGGWLAICVISIGTIRQRRIQMVETTVESPLIRDEANNTGILKEAFEQQGLRRH